MVETDTKVKPHSTAEFWDNYTKGYLRIELSNYQGAHTAFVMAGADRPGATVLEIGCANGVGSEICASSIL